jgi:tetratricopeptide (TPR) repeat protein
MWLRRGQGWRPWFRRTLAKGEAHFLRGRSHSKRDEWKAAAAAYEAALAEDEQSAEWHYQLAVARAKLQEWDRAAAAYEKAIARDDSHALWHYRLGDARSRLENWAGAAAAFEAALVRDAGNADWHFQLALARASLGEWDAAAGACEAALARNAERPEWHAYLGRFRSKLRDWNGAIACFDAAIACDEQNAEWFFRRGVAHEKLQELALAAASYEAAVARSGTEPKYVQHLQAVRARMDGWAQEARALSLAVESDPNDDRSRFLAAAFFVRSGNGADAIAILAPTVAKNDALLENFLAGRGASAHTSPPNRKVLFVRGGKTTLVRKIVVGPDANPEVYLEHTRRGRNGAERVRDFYALVSNTEGASPYFVPRLHYCLLNDEGGYFLFDYLERDVRQTAHFFNRTARLDPTLALGAMDRLIEISRLQYPVGREIPSGTGLRELFARSAENMEQYLQTEWEEHQDDSDYRCSLKSLSRNWANHQRRLDEAPQIFAHANAQSPNAIITGTGDVYFVDWESHGLAPVGLDFVALFSDRCESPQFEELGELYFRAVMPAIGATERTDILALLAVTTKVVTNRSMPRKWLRHLQSQS